MIFMFVKRGRWFKEKNREIEYSNRNVFRSGGGWIVGWGVFGIVGVGV